MKRKLLIAFAVCLLLLTVGVAYFVNVIIWPSRYQVPAELKASRVLLGDKLFEKRLFYQGTDVGEISQILSGWPADREGATLAFVGNTGAHFVDLNGQLRKAIRFSGNVFSPIHIVRLDATGNFGFLTRDESGAGAVLLFDSRGQEVWSYGSRLFSWASDSVAGDINGDGKPEFVVARLDKLQDNIHVMNSEGQELWTSRDLNIWHLELLPATPDGQGKILHSNAGGELVVQDPEGHEVARYLSGHYVGHFAITTWGAEARPTHILAPDETISEADPRRREFFILDSRGKIVSRFATPLGALLPELEGTSFSFGDDRSYYSLLQSFSPANRSLLSLFDEKSHMVYQEILGSNCGAVASVPQASSELLLVGCQGKIWAYRPSKSAED